MDLMGKPIFIFYIGTITILESLMTLQLYVMYVNFQVKLKHMYFLVIYMGCFFYILYTQSNDTIFLQLVTFPNVMILIDQLFCPNIHVPIFFLKVIFLKDLLIWLRTSFLCFKIIYIKIWPH